MSNVEMNSTNRLYCRQNGRYPGQGKAGPGPVSLQYSRNWPPNHHNIMDTNHVKKVRH